MTASHLDPELRSFMETYERLLVLTDTVELTPSLQPQFVARMLRGRPGELIAIQELYDRVREGGEPAEALLEDVRQRMVPLTSLLRSAETREAPEPDQPVPATPPDVGPATPPDPGAPPEYTAFIADHRRLTDIARRVGRGSVDRGLRGLGARPADILALRLLADRLVDPSVEPEDVVDEIRDRRALLDDLLARAGDPRRGQSSDGQTALVARMSLAAGVGATGTQAADATQAADRTQAADAVDLSAFAAPSAAPTLTPSPADRAACDDYLDLYDRLVAAAGATHTAGAEQVAAIGAHVADSTVDIAALAALADRVRRQQAPTRVLATEARRSRGALEALLADRAEPAPVARGPRRFVPGGSARVDGADVADPPGRPSPPRRFTPLVPAAQRTLPPIETQAVPTESPAVPPDIDDAPLVAPVTLPPPPRRRAFDVRRLLILVIVLAVLDLAALSWWYFSRDEPSTESVAAVAPAATTDDASAPTTSAVAPTAPASAAPTTTAPTSRPTTTAPTTTAPTTTAAPATTAPPPLPSTTVLPEVASGDQCHLVPIISYPSLDGAVRFIEEGDGLRTELPRNLRAYPSVEVPGYGQVGYLVAAVGATPEEAEQLVLEAAESGFTTRAITLPKPCPVATLSR